MKSSLIKLIVLGMALAIHAPAATLDPGETALRFLEKVRSRKVNLKPDGDTAITGELTESKKLQIANRYDRLADELGSSELEIAEVKEDSDLAGVLVKQVSFSDPEHQQIIPLALVKRGASWRVAPVPASFENTGEHIDIMLKERLMAVENWLLRGQVTELEKLRKEAANTLKQKILESVDESELMQATAETVLLRFLEACEKKDLNVMLACLGGISKELPEDWPLRLKAANRAMTKSSNTHPAWERLTSPNTLKVVFSSREKGREHPFTLELLTPSHSKLDQSKITRVQVRVFKTSDGFWRIDLPREFLVHGNGSAPENESKRSIELSEDFGTRWSKANPPLAQADAETAFQNFNKVLNSHRLVDLVRLSDLLTNPADASKTCLEVADFWSRFMEPASIIRYSLPMTFLEKESYAVGLVQLVSTRDPEKFETLTLLFERTSAGWLWIPNPTPKALDDFREWVASQTQIGSANWQERLFKKTPLLDMSQVKPSPSAEECESTLATWLDATGSSNVEMSLLQTARLNEPKNSGTLIQNIGYEISNAKLRISPPKILKTYQGNHGSAVGVRIEQKGNKFTYPFYLIVRTSQGPRILAEIDLFASDTNSREFLNSAAFDRLQKVTSEEVANDFRKMFKGYQAELPKQIE
jgi:hypothetical protein